MFDPGNAPAPKVLVGRQIETSLLKTLLQQACGGGGITALITGPAGIGKTSLLRWLEEEATRSGVQSRWGYCLPEVQAPFFPFDQVFRARGGEAPILPPPAGARRKDISEGAGAPGGRPRRAGERSPGPPAPNPAQREMRDDPEAAPKRVAASVLMSSLARLERETLSGPVVILLDDFHWADPESVQVLKFLGRNLRKLPVLLAVALREDEVEDPAFREVLRDLRREGLVRDVTLKGLREKDARQLLESVIEAPFDTTRVRGALRSLLERTGGNPYFLLETAKQLRNDGKIRKERGLAVLDLAGPGGVPHPDPGVPSSVSDLLGKRLQSLPEGDLDILEAAAILGQEFDRAPLEGIFSTRRVEVSRGLRSLSSERGLLLPRGSDGAGFTFAHTLLWQTVKDLTAEEHRRELSLRLASWWERNHPADIERIAALHHLSGDAGKSLQWIERAIEMSLQTHAHERAIGHFMRGLSLLEGSGATPDELARWELSMIYRLVSDGIDERRVEPLCRRLLELNPSEEASLEARIFLVYGVVRRAREARQILTKVRATVSADPARYSPTLRGRMAIIDSVVCYLQGRSEDSYRLAQEAIGLLPPDDTFFLGLAHYRLGWTTMERSDWKESGGHLEKALAIAKAGKAWGLIPEILMLRGSIELMTGRFPAAEQTFDESVAVSKDLGQDISYSISLCNLALARTYRGNLDGAEKLLKEALRLGETFHLPRECGIALQQLGEVQILRRAPEKAMEFFRSARKAFEEYGRGPEVSLLRLDMVDARGRLGDAVGALEELQEVEEQIGEGAGLPGDDFVLLRLIRGRLEMALGKGEEARTDIEEALRESRKRSLPYSEAQSLVVLAEWERRYGSSENAARDHEEAEKALRACGVLDVGLLAGNAMPSPSGEGRDAGAPPRRAPLSARLLRHLAQNGGVEGAFRKDDVAPPALTQKGIADGLGLPREHFNVALTRLVDKGLVGVSLHQVRGAPRKLKVYLLTQAGLAASPRE